jgi:hypothetical protein
MGVRDTARFYPIDGQQYPSVTTVLGIIDKSGPLMGWAVKEERRAFEATLLEVLSHDGARDPLYVRGKMADAVKGVKAAEKVRQDAILIDTAAHALIEWHTRRLLGEKVGPEPMVPDPAAWAVEAWKDWARAVDFTPLSAERTVHCPQCGYAGTFDWVARVAGVVTLGDYKTCRAIYPESFLQNVAYRHAAIHAGFPTAQGVILRLPKLAEDPAFEAMVVPDTMTMVDFRAALRLWRWSRQMEGKPTGGVVSGRCAVMARERAA